jgi:hypothetical protein
MKKSEYRKLKMQLVLVGGLFVSSIVAAIVIVNYRPFFEQYLLEKYKPLPANLTSLAQKIESTGQVPEVFGRLSEKQQAAFYEHWMSLPEVGKDLPKLLASAAPALYIARVEQTLVCGSPEQRVRALQFVELAFAKSDSGNASDSAEALSMLDRVRAWATRRRLSSLETKLQATIAALQPAAN